jgi:hypothetical protein
MSVYGIDKVIGSWVRASGWRLEVIKRSESTALVDVFDPSGQPVIRSYMDNAPCTQMTAHYDEYEGRFEVELWKEGSGFLLDLTHEPEYELDPQRREALVSGIGRYAEDYFLDAYYAIFGPLEHFTRLERRTNRSSRTAAQRSD